MTLQSSGAISLNEIHIEAGGSSGSQASINDSDIRALIGKSSGAQMSFNEWYGASLIPATLTKTGVTPSSYFVLVNNYGMYHNRTYDGNSGYTGGTNASFTESGQFKDSTGATKTFVNFVHGDGYKGASYVEISLLGHNHTNNWSVSAFGITITPNSSFTYSGTTYVTANNHPLSVSGTQHRVNSTVTNSGGTVYNISRYTWRNGSQTSANTNYTTALPAGSGQTWSVT